MGISDMNFSFLSEHRWYELGKALAMAPILVLLSCSGEISEKRICIDGPQCSVQKQNSNQQEEEDKSKEDKLDDGDGSTDGDEVPELNLTKCNTYIRETFNEKILISFLKYKCYSCHNDLNSTASNSKFVIKEGDNFLLENFYSVKKLIEMPGNSDAMSYFLEKATDTRPHVGGMIIMEGDGNFEAMEVMEEDIKGAECPQAHPDLPVQP
jgi:hypothetical protein